MTSQHESKIRSRIRLRTREWTALGVGVLLGGLLGAAAARLEPGWVWPTVACAVLGMSAAGVCVVGFRLEAGVAAIGLSAGAVAGIEGLLLSALALRGDSEKVDSLIGTTAMAVVLGLVCAAMSGLLLSDARDATRGSE